MFRQGFGRIGFFLLVLVTLIVSFTNTWKFLNDFLPGDPPWLRPLAFVFFEGGLILWAQYFKHDSENIYRTFIAGFMTLISLLAVLSATAYEVAKDVQSLGFTLPPVIAAWVPLSILLVMLGQTIMLVLHHFADDQFFARIQHMNKTGRTHPPQVVTGSLVALPQTASAPQPSTVVTPVAQQSGWSLRFPKWLGGKDKQQPAAPQQALPSPATPQGAGNLAPLAPAQEELISLLSSFLQSSQQKAQTNVQEPLNLVDPVQFANDLADSVGGGSASPLPQAPSPNGAKPSK